MASEGGPWPARIAAQHKIPTSASLRTERAEESADIVHEELRLLETGEVPAARHLRVVHQVESALEHAARRVEKRHLGGERRKPRRHADTARLSRRGSIVGRAAIEPHAGGRGV